MGLCTILVLIRNYISELSGQMCTLSLFALFFCNLLAVVAFTFNLLGWSVLFYLKRKSSYRVTRLRLDNKQSCD